MSDSVQRYGVVGGLGASHPHLSAYVLFSTHPSGDYVLHSDYAKVEAEREFIRQQCIQINNEREALREERDRLAAERGELVEALADAVRVVDRILDGFYAGPRDGGDSDIRRDIADARAILAKIERV